jgi:hypothetical protein
MPNFPRSRTDNFLYLYPCPPFSLWVTCWFSSSALQSLQNFPTNSKSLGCLSLGSDSRFFQSDLSTPGPRLRIPLFSKMIFAIPLLALVSFASAQSTASLFLPGTNPQDIVAVVIGGVSPSISSDSILLLILNSHRMQEQLHTSSAVAQV